MNVNPMQLLQMIKGGQNPQQLVMSLIKQQNNPVINNAVNLAQKGDMTALEMVARNLAQQRGLDFDKEFASFKNYIGK